MLATLVLKMFVFSCNIIEVIQVLRCNFSKRKPMQSLVSIFTQSSTSMALNLAFFSPMGKLVKTSISMFIVSHSPMPKEVSFSTAPSPLVTMQPQGSLPMVLTSRLFSLYHYYYYNYHNHDYNCSNHKGPGHCVCSETIIGGMFFI